MRATADLSPTTDPLHDDAHAAGCRTLVDLYRLRAARQPEVIVYRFLPGPEVPELALSYAALDRRARAIARTIREHAAPGDRAILLFAPGLDYVAAFVACAYAGVVAVPAYPPHPRRPDERVPRIVADCEARLALTSRALLGRLERWRASEPVIASLHWIATDAIDEGASDGWEPAAVDEASLAMLQYTS
ncbi:MAG TPA: AMP-binding protein, partial [Gemmatimonadaceae bacterium]|nr:AMP-binding protein [Gemmatimonadaceae bacterium]